MNKRRRAIARSVDRALGTLGHSRGRYALAAASTEVGAACRALRLRGIVARAAVFTSTSPGVDISRLAIEQDVDLVLVAYGGQLDDPEVTALLLRAPCDVAVAVGPEATACELGSWLAASWQVTLRLAGPAAEGGRDASWAARSLVDSP